MKKGMIRKYLATRVQFPGGASFFFCLKGDIILEEIKRLYKKLHTASNEEREKLWKIIIKKNRILFNKRKDELNKLLKK